MNFNFEKCQYMPVEQIGDPNMRGPSYVLIYITVILNKSKLRNLSYKISQTNDTMCQIFRVMFRIREAYIFCFIFPCLRCYTGSYCTIEINSKEVSAFYFLFIFSHSEATVRAMADQVQFVKTFFSQHSVVTIIIAYTVPTSESGFKNSNHDINSFWIKSYVGQAKLIALKLSNE